MSLSQRAVIHAAFAHPGRLAITDILTAGDAAPSELGTALGMSTNLVAHHVNVLEQAGLVRRTRSEADRRRTYIQLIPATPEAIATPVLAPTPAKAAATRQANCWPGTLSRSTVASQ